jgi:hypothetical protein
MKTIAISTAIALLGAAFSVGASAQTGTPSAREVGRSTAIQTAPVNTSDAEVGSYARYLILNGASREDAVKAAQNVDHSTVQTRFAWHRARAQAAGTQTTPQ